MLGEAEARPEHHKDLNKKILIAVIVSSTLLGGILLSLSCYWIYRRQTLKNSDTKTENSLGIFFMTDVLLVLFFPVLFYFYR